ncbi:MAG TPA: sporulation YhaL family protein [Pseudogracilibacillus sp.]|nr:sporulation YhaL family protein [Pseudogracilibacillus sp.]
MLESVPIWVYIVCFFIVFSGYSAFRAWRAEKRLEQQYIEREGEIYMERIRQEKKRREHQTS